MKNELRCHTDGCKAVFGRLCEDELQLEVEADLLGEDKFRCVVFDGRVVVQCPDCCRLNTFTRERHQDQKLELVEKQEYTFPWPKMHPL